MGGVGWESCTGNGWDVGSLRTRVGACDMAGVGGCVLAVASRCFYFPFLGSRGDSRLGWPSLSSLVLTGANWKPWKPFRRRVQSMAGAGQWAGSLPPAPLLYCRHGQPPVACAGRSGAAPAWGALGQGLFSSGKVRGSSQGCQAGPEAHCCRHQAVSPQPLNGAQVVAAPPWVWLTEDLAMGHMGAVCQHGKAPLGSPCPCPPQGRDAIWACPSCRGVCEDPRATLVGQRDTFLCTQATVPSALGCSGQRSLATCGVPGEPSVSVLPQAIPPASTQPVPQRQPSPVPWPPRPPGWQHLPTGMTKGHNRGPGWAQLQGC